MTKFKKVFLTVALAFCCVACSTLGVLGLMSKNTVRAEESGYETATVYDVSQLSASGPAGKIADTKTDWFAGRTSNPAYVPFEYNNKGYTLDTTTNTLKSVGITFSLKLDNAWTADCTNAIRLFVANTEMRWHYKVASGFKFEIFDWNDPLGVANRAKRVNPNDTDAWIDNFDATQYHTYTIVKSLKTDDASSYKLDLYIDGVQEYTASFSNITPAQYSNWAVDQLRLYNNGANTSSITVKSAHTLMDAQNAKDVYDYKAKDEYLLGKAFTTTYNETTNSATANADGFDSTNTADVSADTFGVTFKVKFDTAVVEKREVIRARLGSTFDVRLSVVTAGTSGRAQINAFDWQSDSASNKILGATDYQFDIDFTQEHTYTFIKEKIEGATNGYAYSAYVDGVLIQRAVYNVAPAASWGGRNDYTNHMRIIIQNGNYTGTFSSAKYYGVKVDNKVNKVNVGESYTLTAPAGKLCFGFESGNDYAAVGAKINRASTWTSVCAQAENLDGAAVRMLYANESSLKWTTVINKADYDALVEKYGEENVKVSYRIWTEEDTSKEIRKEVDASQFKVTETTYEFYPLLSKIKTSHFDWKFKYAAYITVTIDGQEVECEIYNEECTRSIAGVAETAYNYYRTQEQFDALSEEEKAIFKYEIEVNGVLVHSAYSKTQRDILAGYFDAE